jgi:hypothetical protein
MDSNIHNYRNNTLSKSSEFGEPINSGILIGKRLDLSAEGSLVCIIRIATAAIVPNAAMT